MFERLCEFMGEAPHSMSPRLAIFGGHWSIASGDTKYHLILWVEATNCTSTLRHV